MSVFFCVVLKLLVNIILSEYPPSPPLFTWDRIPLFIHAQNESGELNDTAAKYMSSFPLATVEKGQGQSKTNPICSSPCEEDKIINAIHKIRSYNESTRTIFYLNTIINYPQYNLSTEFYGKNEKYLLHDVNGNLVYLKQCQPNAPNYTVFDHSQNETRQIWLDTVKYAMTKIPGIVDGIYADRAPASTEIELNCVNLTQEKANAWNQGHIQVMEDAMTIVKQYNPKQGIIIPNNANIPTLNVRFFENFRYNDTYGIPSGDDLNILMNNNGIRIAEVHKDKCVPYSEAYNQSLSAFLIGAYKYCYYACTTGWTLQEGWDTMWENIDYHKELGEPNSNATLKNGIYYREFKKGVKVYLDTKWEHPCIKWNDGTITGTSKDCDSYKNM